MRGSGSPSVIQNHAELKVTASGFGELPQPSEIFILHCGRRFDLDSYDPTGQAFHHNVDFVLVLVSEVEEAAGFGEPRGLAKKLGIDEGGRVVRG